MAVAGVIIQCVNGDSRKFMEEIRLQPSVVEIQLVPGQEGGAGSGPGTTFAAVLECRSDTILGEMEKIKKLPFVLLIDMTYINYEEELETGDSIPCPPYERRRKNRDFPPVPDE